MSEEVAEPLPREFEAWQVTLRWSPGRRRRWGLRGRWEVKDTFVAGWVALTVPFIVTHVSSLWRKVQVRFVGAGFPMTLQVKDAEVLEDEMREGSTRWTSGSCCS